MHRAVTTLALWIPALACLDFDALDRCFGNDCGDEVGPPCIEQVTAGWTHTCARKSDGSVWCWGNNNAAQVGVPSQSVSMLKTPQKVASVVNATQIAAGDSFTCALTPSGAVVCWGFDDRGQLGPRGPDMDYSFAAAVGDINDARQVATGQAHACAVRTDATVLCWGANEYGQTGDGALADHPYPGPVVGLGDVAAVALGWDHSCALKDDGSVWCWGRNERGQLGDGTRTDRRTPAIASLISDVSHLAAGFHHSCAVKRDGSVWCWGSNQGGQLGDGTTADSPVPVEARGITSAAEVSIGGYETLGPIAHTCARSTDGRVWCWGSNAFGQIGDGSQADRSEPRQIGSISNATAIAAGATHSCAARGKGRLLCWGASSAGQLGTSGLEGSTVPVTAALSCP